MVIDDYGRAYFFQQVDDSSPALIGEDLTPLSLKIKFLINSMISPGRIIS